MRKKWFGFAVSLLLLFSFVGVHNLSAAAVKPKLLPSNDYLQLPYVNDNGKKIQLRGYQNFEVDWSDAASNAWQAKLDGDRLLLLDGAFTKAVSGSNGRELWKHDYKASNALFLKDWGLSAQGTLFTIRQGVLDKTVDPRIDLIDRSGKVKSTYTLPYDRFIFPEFTTSSAMDSRDNLITVTSGNLISLSPQGELNWAVPDIGEWTATITQIADYSFTWYKTSLTELIVDSRDNVLALTDSDYAYYLSRNGELLWQKQLDRSSKDWSASGFIPATDQWVRAYGNPSPRVEILDLKSGKLTKVNKPTTAQLDLVLTKAGKGKYYVEAKRGIVQIDASGKTLWEYPLRLNGYYTVGAMLSDSKGNVYIKDNGGSVFSLDPAGNERFVLIVKNKNSISDILVDGKGTLYLIDTDFGTLAIKPKQK
ncbi:PQQ-binding-like beta-propeller repeat protein [Cohnella cellulosilytica]|uniref:PQQ-binding-like beta-propeller repeat protein n=1 Tax=Cohnella cellulosilytica TaxID=986710 RepID=A0ABW2FF49_9BACL